MRRYIVLSLSVVAMLCLGGVYAWSEFVPHLRSVYGLSTAQTQAVFGTTIAVFTLVMVLAGKLLGACGPRVLLAAGGLLVGAGYVAASLSRGGFWPMLVGYGVVGGAGLGLGYLCSLAVSVDLFPERRGAVTGLTVGGFGGAAVVLSNIARPLLEGGTDPLVILRGVGFVYGAVVLLCSLAFPARLAASGDPGRDSGLLGRLARKPALWLHVVGLFCGTFAGLMIIGNIKPIALSVGTDAVQVGLAVSAMAVGNVLGRVAWGGAADRIGWKSIPLSLATLAVAVALLLPAGRLGAAFTVVTVIVATGFGSCFVVHAAEVAARWENGALATVYPAIFLAYGLAGLAGPPVGGWIYDTTGSYAWAAAVAAIATLVGVVATTGIGATRRRDGLT